MISRTNAVLTVVLGVVVVLASLSGVDYSRPNVEILADLSMKYSPAPTPYEVSGVFANGMTQQEPVAGTIKRGDTPLYFAPLPQGLDLKNVDPVDSVPGKELVNPLSRAFLLEQATMRASSEGLALVREMEASHSVDTRSPDEVSVSSQLASDPSDTDSSASNVVASESDSGPGTAEEKESPDDVAEGQFQESVRRGNGIFVSFCVCCHGAGGAGDGMVTQRGYPPPPSFLSGTSNQWNDGQLFHIVTYGRANMPRFAAELPRESRWDVINFIRSLQESEAASATDKQSGVSDETSSEIVNGDDDIAREELGAEAPGETRGNQEIEVESP